MNNPMTVGITGGIGSGKSTVAKIFSILGIPVYFADDRAKWLMSSHAPLKSAIITHFGEESYTSEGHLNRSYLANQVFNDPAKTALINSLVHPAVKKDFEQWISIQHSPYILKEAALLFETGSYKELDMTINVSSPLIIRITRIMLRDPHRTEAQIHAIIDKQLPDEQKNALADFIIKNADNKLLIPQVLKIHEKIIRQSETKN
ncbi:dephospho-CoA kinase [Mongoliitalea daihaiensis]|uniref:dephospho-CoA kinase n=1 Tax=Mongoliitalea daihaiensis TaxID=2782006 RepID=UPI001EE9E641|nr:dephospho-CoA kinase [Mongoliitalea daihaiensis]UJP65643.1 dephospho-CoA kinase [Mongoliitalea daihaiensis]